MQEFNKFVVFLPILCDIMLKNFRFVKSWSVCYNI